MLKTTPPNSYTSIMKTDIRKLVDDYEDLRNIDKLHAVNSRVNEVKSVMHSNIEQVIRNTDAVENIEAKTENMRDTAKYFSKSSSDLERNYYWRNMKIKAILGCLVLIVVLYFTVPMLTSDS